MIQIGDISVLRGEPEEENPYRNGGGILGGERRESLKAFKNGAKKFTYTGLGRVAIESAALKNYTFWYAPIEGGARRIKANEIDWERSGIE